LGTLEPKLNFPKFFPECDDIFLDFGGGAFGFDYVKHEVAEVFDVAFAETSAGDVLETYAQA
jgi:hypothetical protein